MLPPAINASRFFLSLAILFMLRLPAVIAPPFSSQWHSDMCHAFLRHCPHWARIRLCWHVPHEPGHSSLPVLSFLLLHFSFTLWDTSSPFSKLMGIDEFLAQLCVVRKVIGSVVASSFPPALYFRSLARSLTAFTAMSDSAGRCLTST